MEFRENKDIHEIIQSNVKKGDDSLSIADDILNGSYNINSNLEKIQFPGKMEWNYEHSKAKNTYQLYLHTLNFLNDLTRSYETTEKEVYIKKAHDILDSWLEDNLERTDKKNYAWYDHPVANRIANILYFQLKAPNKYKLSDKVMERVLQRHLDFLADNSNYPENNHGIMMDKALILGSICIEETDIRNSYVDEAINRLEKAFLRDYSYKNVHLENSPEYHRMVTIWLSKISDILEKIDRPLNSKYKLKLEKALDYNGIIINYNGMYPTIGDTSAGRAKYEKRHDDFVDMEAGVAVFNNKSKKSTLIFNCGFQNKTHKHFDDLSIYFSVNKEDIFVDGGKYNYSKKDPLRQYILSPKAHTTVYVKDATYDIQDPQPIEITNYYSNPKYKYTSGVMKGYEGAVIRRHIILIGGENLIIVDQVESEKQKIYSQNFLLAPEVKAEKVNNRIFSITTASNKEYILKEHSEKGASAVRFGEKNEAMLSEKFSELVDCYRVEINKKVVKNTFITSFTPSESEVEIVKSSARGIVFRLNGSVFNIPLHTE